MKTNYYFIMVSFIFCTSCQERYSDVMIQQQLLWNATLQRSNLVLKKNTLLAIEEAKKFIETRTQYHSFYPKFKSIATFADSIYNHIEHLKTELIEHSGAYLTPLERAEIETLPIPKGAKETKVVQMLFVVPSHNNKVPASPVQTLTTSIQAMHQHYLHLIENSWDDGGIKGTVFADISRKEEMIKQIKAALELPFLSPIYANPASLELLLKDKSLALVLTLLSSIQNDICKQEYHVFNFFARQINRMHAYKRIGLWSISSKSCIRLGETFQSKIILTNDSYKTLHSVVVDGDSLPIVDKRAIYTVQPNQAGEQVFRPTITFLNSYTNTIDSITKTFYFDVLN